MKSEINIVVSKKEAFIGGAQLILRQVWCIGSECRITFIDDFISDGLRENRDSNKKIFYFLTNVAEVPEFVKDVLSKGHTVINEAFLLGETSKFYLQKTIERCGVTIPKSFCSASSMDAREMGFPCYLKSQKQSSSVIKVADEKEFNKAVSLFDCNNESCYIEEEIAGNDVRIQKIYYVDGKISFKEGSALLKSISDSISKALKLEVFSADIIFSKSGKYWVIDVNPAPSFFKSDEARDNFASFLLNKQCGPKKLSARYFHGLIVKNA